MRFMPILMLSSFFTISLVAHTSSPANPAKKKIDLRPKQEKIEDPGSATPLIYKTTNPAIPSSTDTSTKLSVTATCTDPMGMVVKAGSKGYEACLRALDKAKPNEPNQKNPNSVGISFGN